MITILACATILHSLYADHVATANLFRYYGPAYEANNIIRQVGYDPYYLAGYAVSMIPCSAEQRGEWWPKVLAVAVWGVQTWAVGTHGPYGTDRAGPPMLFFSIRW